MKNLFTLLLLFSIFILFINKNYTQNIILIEKKNKSDSSLSTVEIQKGFNFYIISSPNPCKNHVFFRIFGLTSIKGNTFKLKLYDMNGIEIKDLTLIANECNDGDNSQFDVDFKEFIPGIYFAQLTYANYSICYKFLKYD
jgi:hypothetical protein